MDFQLDDDGDLYLDDTGTIPLVTGKTAIVQHLKIRLRSVKGEWFLDETDGVPYFEEILGQKIPDLARIRRIFERVITGTPGVESLDRMELTLDREERQLRVHDVEVSTTDGDEITADDFGAFTVEV
jgi:hypothetical protein